MTESHTAGSQPTPGIFLHLTCSKAIISSICSCKTEMIMGKLSIRHPRCRQKLRNDNDKVVTASLKNTTRTKDDNEKVVYQTKNNEKVVDQQKCQSTTLLVMIPYSFPHFQIMNIQLKSLCCVIPGDFSFTTLSLFLS